MKTTLVLFALSIGAGALAQNTPPPATSTTPPTATGNTVVLSPSQTIASAVAGMAKAANATVVVDPALTGNVTGATAKLPLEQGLSAIAAANHARWNKAYLRDAEIPRKADGSIDATRLRQIVEAAASVPKVTVGVMDPATGTIAMTTRYPANAAEARGWIADKKAIYLLYRPVIVGMAVGNSGDMVSDYLTTQRNSMDTFRSMSPEQRAAAMKQGLEMMLNTDPEIMAQMTRDSMQALQSLTPEMKAKLMDMSMKMMGGMAPGSPPAK